MSEQTYSHDSYPAQVQQIFTSLEELSLFKAPSVYLEGGPAEFPVVTSGAMDGVPIAITESDPGSAESPDDRSAADRAAFENGVAIARWTGLATRAKIQSYNAEITRNIPEANEPGFHPSDSQQQVIDALRVNTYAWVDSAQRLKYAKYVLGGADLSMPTEVTTAVLYAAGSDQIIARGFTFSDKDAFVRRTIEVDELPLSQTGESKLHMAQTLEPIKNSDMEQWGKFFSERDDMQGLITLNSVLYDMFAGIESPSGLSELYSRYTSPYEADSINKMVEAMRSNVAAYGEARALRGLDPSFGKPSSQDLADCQALLDSVRT